MLRHVIHYYSKIYLVMFNAPLRPHFPNMHITYNLQNVSKRPLFFRNSNREIVKITNNLSLSLGWYKNFFTTEPKKPSVKLSTQVSWKHKILCNFYSGDATNNVPVTSISLCWVRINKKWL